MNHADRVLNLSLFAGAVVAWAALAYVFLTRYPTESATSLLAGTLLLGGAVGLTATPLFWIGSYVRTSGIVYRGSWWRAGRRAALLGLVVGLFVLMRGQDVFSVPLAMFIVAMAVLVETTLTLRA